jgi:hypothetical protein
LGIHTDPLKYPQRPKAVRTRLIRWLKVELNYWQLLVQKLLQIMRCCIPTPEPLSHVAILEITC